ncbi:hypothetical protein Bca4012_068408 [Brassica carinata]|uniref:Uncharacterized protein n=1 Tax=Brassica carinata TaxID=52824 RepID=A0A8X7VU58_BRACI|nr:hypothetical protein Bca52824_020638 [Brassica carinata]
MDPAAEKRDTKRNKEYINMLYNVADSQYEIPMRCSCGGSIIHEVRGKDDYDTLPGKLLANYVSFRVNSKKLGKGSRDILTPL